MSDIVAASYPEIPCPQVFPSTTGTGTAQTSQNVQISRITAVTPTRLEIALRDFTTGIETVDYMEFTVGTVSGGWGEGSTLPGRITQVDTLKPTSGNLLPADGLKITGQRLNKDLTVKDGFEVGYIFFTGTVKVAGLGVSAPVGSYINNFYSNTITGTPFGRRIFIGTYPAATGTNQTTTINLKCYDRNAVRPDQMAALNIVLNTLLGN